MVRLIFLLGFLFYSYFSYSQKMWSGYEQLVQPVQNYVVYQAISEIDLPLSTKTENVKSIFYEMKTKGHFFTVTLENQAGLKLSLNQNGLFQILNK